MTERPILFSRAMVRAMLAGTKTQTRRVVKASDRFDALLPSEAYPEEWVPWISGEPHHSLFCPYGLPGDLLWVREAMPRWASRISLRITDVRVERLQDISHKDACAEGLISKPHHWHDPEGPLNDVGYLPWEGAPDIYSEAPEAYRALWEHINGSGSWDANPWVWAVSFERAA